MKKLKKLLAALLALAMLLSMTLLTGCDQGGQEDNVYRGENYRKELEKPTGRNLYGMMYIAYEGQHHNGWDAATGMELMKNLGVKMIRLDIPASAMFPTMDTRNEEVIAEVHGIIAEAQKRDIEIIGVALPDYRRAGWDYSGTLIRRSEEEDSEYRIWMENLEEMYCIIASELKEVTLWEMGNEPNGSRTYTDGKTAGLEEVAEIYTEQMYYASLGMHRANPDNVSIMGAFTEPEGLGHSDEYSYEDRALWGPYGDQGRAIGWLNYIYDFILGGGFASIYPDDYFQAAAWHPYTFRSFDADYFVAENQKIYDVILQREGKDKRVYFTEIGFSDGFVGESLDVDGDTDGSKKQEVIARLTKDLYETVAERMPYVETVCWFRAFNDTRDRYWAGDDDFARTLTMYGLFYDPNPDAKYPDLYPMDVGVSAVPGAPKPVAFAYQQVAGGQGPLDLFVKDED